MNLQFLRNEFNGYTAAASATNRQIALAGIAVVWILVQQKANLAIETTALKWFVIALALDLLQSVIGSAFWGVMDRIKENELKKKHGDNHEAIESADFEVTGAGNIFTWLCFGLKIASVATGYFYLWKMLS